MDGEDRVATDLLQGRLLVRTGGGQLARALDEQERRVALVEVPRRRRDAQRTEQPHAAHAEHHLLVQPHLPAADVELVGDGPVGALVLGDVRVEQQERHPSDLGQPDGGMDDAAGKLDGDLDRVAVLVEDPQQRQPGRVVVRVGVLLVAVGVDRLAEVAMPVEKADADERDGHVGGGLAMVAGQHAQAAGVDAERLVEAELGAEVGDRTGQLRRRGGAGTSGRHRWRCRRRSARACVSYSTRKSVSSRSRDQSRMPWRTGMGLR